MTKILSRYREMSVVAKATIWFVICSTLQKCISVLTTPIFTRIMSTEQYGQFSVYNSWLQILMIITSLRLSWSVFNKGMSKFRNDRAGYASTMQTLTLFTTGIIFAVYLAFHNFFNRIIELPTFIMVAIFAELFLTPAIDFWTVKKRYEYEYKAVVARTLFMSVLNAGIGIVAVLMSEEKGFARILSCVAVNVCFGTVIFVSNRKAANTWFKWEYAKYALAFNLPLILHYLSQYVMDQFDRIMIQKLVGLTAAGIYSVAYNAGMLLKIVTQSANNALIPWEYERLEKKQMKEFDNVLFVVFIAVACIAMFFICFAPEMMRILAGEKYYEAVYAIPPVVIGLFFLFMYTTFANVEFFYEQNRFTMYISMIGAVSNIIMNYFGIKMFGYIAAAYTTLICYIIFAFSHYVYMTYSVKKALQIDKVFKTNRLLILSAVVLFGGIAVAYLYKYTILRYCVCGIIIAVAYIKRNVFLDMLEVLKRKKT